MFLLIRVVKTEEEKNAFSFFLGTDGKCLTSKVLKKKKKNTIGFD